MALEILNDDGLRVITQPVIDSCTLNNALNVVQLAVLLALLKWARRST